ncbi:lysozyme inhibitor LprI family protein [Paraburkholderia sp. IMGN_8]|uniref:lysozyme inhibitor LprI family protein n=1 Tax=Paraburkholderia sp. IMGN_8 TaxID=3136564 RepID=UPI0031010ECA
MKIIGMVLAGLFLISNAAHSRPVCGSPVTREIETCAESNFKEADAELNRVYQALGKKWVEGDRKQLQQAQRYWIQYKTKYCQAAFDETSPGQEAGIDKWACLESVTFTRTRELLFLDNSYSMKDFKRALTFMANEYENGNEGQVLNKLARDMPDGKNQDWLRYVEANCQMTHTKLREEHDVCVARMNFYKNW